MFVNTAVDQEFTTSPVVALHSSASSARQWKQFTTQTEGRFDVIALDLPGYGASMHTIQRAASRQASAALSVIASLHGMSTPVHLVGHSNGAGVAIKVALMRPDLVKSLTLFEPAAFHFLKSGDAEDRKFFAEIGMISAILTTSAASSRPDLGMRRFIDFWNGEGSWASMPEERKESFSRMAPAVMNDFARGFAETWTLQDLAAIDVSVRLISGSRSPEIARHVARQIAFAIPGAELAQVNGVGHMGPVTHPEIVNPAILGNINQAERASRHNAAAPVPVVANGTMPELAKAG